MISFPQKTAIISLAKEREIYSSFFSHDMPGYVRSTARMPSAGGPTAPPDVDRCHSVDRLVSPGCAA
jgi:hypothetical protein